MIIPCGKLMWRPKVNPGRITVKRLALLVVVLFPVVLTVLLLGFWVKRFVPEWIYWQAALVFLLAVELAYGLMVAASIPGALVLGLLLFRPTLARPARVALARPFLLCISLLIASLAAEAAAAIWQYRAHRFSGLPLGGLQRDTASSPHSRFRAPVADFTLKTDFPDPPGDRDIDLVILGESSAEGVPYSNWLSIGSMLIWKMSQAIPDRRIRPRVLARSGDTLEWQHRELTNLPRRPDLLIVFCGHNELTARLAGSRDVPHYDDDTLPTAWDILVQRVEQSSPLAGLIHETAEKCRIAIPPSPGRRTLVDVPCYAPLEFNTLLADFQRRLETIVSYAERVGALPVLILPAANDAGFEPNRSFLPPQTPRSDRESFQQEFLTARRLEAGDPAASRKRYETLLARQPGFAETHYRLARLDEQQGAWDEAYRHFVAARDRDGYPMRLTSRFQQVYRDVAARHDCILIDAQSYFHEVGRHGLLDDDLFQDAMHPSLRGQIALAQRLLQALQARRAFGWPQDSRIPVIDPAECAARFGLGPAAWRVVCLWGLKFNGLAAPLRYDPSRRLQARDAYAAAADHIAAGAAPESAGLSNVGIPAPVPVVSLASARSRSASEPALNARSTPVTDREP